MPSRKVVAPKLSNPFLIFAESDTEDCEISVLPEPIIVSVVEPLPVALPVVPPPPLEIPLRIWKVPQENRFEAVILSNRVPENSRLGRAHPPFTHQKGRWMKSRIESEDGWISLRPRPEHEQAAIEASGIDQSILPVEVITEHHEEYPRSASEWAERVRQTLEKAEAAPRRSDSSERLKEIRDSIGRLSFFRRPLTDIP